MDSWSLLELPPHRDEELDGYSEQYQAIDNLADIDEQQNTVR
ncbi:hypothetical protein [Paracoccus sp. 22332]